jgi:hypothetical protein
VRFYHRPISAIVDALADAGFLIERIPEPVPDPTAFSDRAFYERIRRGPWFLFIRAVSRPTRSARAVNAGQSDRGAQAE